MSGFTAINIEPEDNIEEEIDDTKEIQIEEALKLYQTALKLHSQGPEFYDVARDAYIDLFQSEVFNYPEVASDYGEEQLYEALPTGNLPVEQESIPLVPGNSADSAANSLPQLIYLAFKNRAQLALDLARNKLGDTVISRRELFQWYDDACLISLQDSAQALERDDSDLDLWKKAARVSDVLVSQRLVRFCLESVLAGDDDGGDQAIDISGLDEAFASGELEQVFKLIGDNLSYSKIEPSRPKPKILTMLQKSNDAYPYLPRRSEAIEYLDDRRKPNSRKLAQIELTPVVSSRDSLGETILEALRKYKTVEANGQQGPFVRLTIPEDDDGVEADTDMPDNPLPDDMDTSVREGTTAEAPNESPKESIKSPASFHSAPEVTERETEDNAETTALKSGESAIIPESSTQGDATREVELPNVQEESRMSSRKRSSTAAGMEEHESRTKSKRLRARESMLELAAQDEDPTLEVSHYNGEMLAVLEDADERSFGFLNKLLDSLSMQKLGPLSAIRSVFWQEEAVVQTPSTSYLEYGLDLLLMDMRQILTSWTDEKGATVISGHGKADNLEKSSGLALFTRHLRADHSVDVIVDTSGTEDHTLGVLMQRMDKGLMTIYDAAFVWLASLITTVGTKTESPSYYMAERWSDTMKKSVTNLSIEADEQLYNIARKLLSQLSITVRTLLLEDTYSMSSSQTIEFIQTMFEIHLDMYTSLLTPESQTDEASKTEQFDRLQRWAQLGTECMEIYSAIEQDIRLTNPIVLRFIWASTKVTGYTSDNDKSHILLCLEDLHTLLVKAGSPVITLPNNATMPQISVAAVEQERSRLATLDFFLSVFDADNNDPVTIIMKLEPILEYAASTPENSSPTSAESASVFSNQNEQLREFLDSGDASLKLFLWRRLQNAYTSISYSPKVVSCLLRSFEVIVRELRTERHASLEPGERQNAMLHWLHDADGLVAKILNKITEESRTFESLDDQHLASSMEAVVSAITILHGFVLFDDSIRVGQTPVPALRPSSLKIFDKSRDRFREAYVRLWTLLFHLLKEASVQKANCFTQPTEELAEYLRNVHNAFGYRQYCKHCNKLFVKLAKNELLALRSEVDYSMDLTQILYDMYQIKFGMGIGDADHGCVPDLLRDKATAMTLVPIIMAYATRLNVRDLIKSELKGTIDKIQQCLGPVRSSPALSFNKKIISNFLKSQINPQAVYRSLNGIGDLTTKLVHGDHTKIAASGWYLLLGKLSLAKFKSIKRVNPTATDDLDTAATYLRHDIEHNIMNWESWYRLAQVFDAKIEDSLIWNAAKLNDSRGDIANLERNAINSYTMAVAMAMRIADDTPDTVQDISDMFSEFAFRLYASSRPPLDMVAFQTDKIMRHISNSLDQSMSKEPFVRPFTEYGVWSFATHLLRRKFKTNSREWFCQYTLGKCLWKMFQSRDNARARQPVSIEDALEAFSDAIALVPKKEKSSEYILEPHYKLASVVHKLVYRKTLDARKGIEYLRGTQFAKGARLSEDEQGQVEWEPYILDVLNRIGRADKSNWHHRITARAAHVIYDDDPTVAGALGAKHQFAQQIFTKTMTMQVWKPEHERPGRHYVYTGRYLSFFVHLLEQLNDRESMEQLVRRIRRKTTDFLDHPKIWEQTATTYLRLLRRVAKIPEGCERATFDKIGYEDFSKLSERVESWAHKQDSSSIYLSTISDAIELKKLNNSLMKGPAIDDLIGDTYACMYEAVTSQLSPEEVVPQQTLAVPQSTFVNITTEVTPIADNNLDRMRLNNLLSAQIDGVTLANIAERPGLNASLQPPSRATPPVDPARISTPTKPGRPKTITKREIQRKAEAAISKLQPIKLPTLGKKLVVDIPSIKRPRPSFNNNNAPERDTIRESKDEEAIEVHRNSRHPSVDSNRNSDNPAGEDDNENEADDESELSEIADGNEESRRPSLFPGSTDGKVDGEGDAEADDEDGEGDREGDEAGSDGDEEDNDGQDDENNEEGEGDEGEDEDEEDEVENENENGNENDHSEDEPEGDIDETMDETMDVDADEENEDGMEIQDSQDRDRN